jgi:hypothetical protein
VLCDLSADVRTRSWTVSCCTTTPSSLQNAVDRAWVVYIGQACRHTALELPNVSPPYCPQYDHDHNMNLIQHRVVFLGYPASHVDVTLQSCSRMRYATRISSPHWEREVCGGGVLEVCDAPDYGVRANGSLPNGKCHTSHTGLHPMRLLG